jgi:hypothetical protein
MNINIGMDLRIVTVHNINQERGASCFIQLSH